ncbi:cell division protein FtsI [Glutamicibacter uratoxydans]|uniref:Cell division protein FtsI n=1 Tax=Glutamicibacter uratoxydans TaxID=43667 RepID=A0A4Y4DRZ4_GLUUR|nr:penicillin-binding transpeptidase domain-containing protein [Glutamicibacter uratoxydans]GED06674.1 cell division protein FtsI [Glutamicibacter uratoxydans]
MRALRRKVIALSIASLVAGSLSACSSAPADPTGSADALVAALNSGDFSAVSFTDTDAAVAAENVKTAFGKLDGIARKSSLGSVAVDEQEQNGVKTATATIDTVMDVDDTDQDFKYQTKAVWEYDDQGKTWQLRFSPAILAPNLAEGDFLAASFVPAARGNITDGDGKNIVADRPVVNVGIDKTRASKEEWKSSAKALAKLVEIDPDAYVAKVEAAGDKAWVQAIVLRDDSTRKATDEQIAKIPGAVAQKDEIPLAPSRNFARPLLGSVGEATAEVIEKSQGKIRAGDQVGLSGLQAAYNDTLSGEDGVSIARYNADKESQEELFTSKPTDGKDVQLTLDQKLQQSADDLLEDAKSNSAIVVIRPSDGAVLAASSGPVSSGLNTALQGKYAPGSSFKVISALAMIRNGDNANTKVQCPATTTIDGRTFSNYDGYPTSALGTIPLSEAIAQSCNTVFLNQGAEIGGKKLAEAAAALGLTGEDGTGAGAQLGSVPTDSTGTEQAANMIGQGVVQASPLGMATVAASVQAQHTVSPKLVLSPEPKAPAAPASKLTKEEATELASMMAQVIDHGTLKDLKGTGEGKIIGKSGTAEYDSERNAHAWAIAAQGDIAIAAFVEDGNGGAQTAGPLVKSMLKAAN